MTSFATFTFALPEDTDSNFFQLWSSSTEDGVYAQVGTDIAYTYGTVNYEFNAIDEAKWYKLRFYNSVTGDYSPYSDAVFGGDWSSNSSPFLSVSTTTDGANYATIENVYEYAGLTSSDISEARVSQALRRSRAIVDLRTADMRIDRFQYTFSSSVARRKYNASLRVLREAEITFALGMCYRNLADDEVLDGLRSADSKLGAVSVGSTNLTIDATKKGIENSNYFSRLAQKYTLIGSSMLQLLNPTSIEISWQEPESRNPKFAVGGCCHLAKFDNPAGCN